MPPKAAKSKEAPAERPILGRFSSHIKIGIVGLPNAGKSTLFNTLRKLSIPAENFPFCTIEPNEARVNVPDERFELLVAFRALGFLRLQIGSKIMHLNLENHNILSKKFLLISTMMYFRALQSSFIICY
ncbi:hypothetical protein ES319_D10G162200v1 [Gossypium barbadense]|uniref:G domain-containing protein n=2 Tax=Gossypium TaxID=3633 RepID=A0A5J5PTT6_GOSBA|nr:hypothetical protein ES319_D10G162200v1 [Gossypium barbadense]KAB2009373.1 hypothetical protein ES319_D10G162200v1 [Gossypium barbadense]PPD79169.1 hypothetical protein GOBAR_DD23903 [Gossypium barbadense]TYG50409.1 hypothetical protein ES288_D10G173200v1 [Gossypium darwinii]